MLISFEGIDGSGKSTQIQRLAARLKDSGEQVETFREPGGTDVSEKIRSMLLNPACELNAVTELFLFSAARSQLMTEQVLPLLEKGYVVILDRFYDSTTAYQGYGRELMDLESIGKMNEKASHGRAPDLTIYMKLTVEQARKRTEGGEADRMEQSSDEFYKRVIQGFDTLAQNNKRFVTVDATQSKEKIEQKIWQKVRSPSNK